MLLYRSWGSHNTKGDKICIKNKLSRILLKKEIKNLGLEETLIEITFNSEKSSFEEGYVSCTPKIISGIQEGYTLNFDLKKN